MYTPPLFREDEKSALAAAMAAGGFGNLITATAEGLIGTPLPMIYDPDEGPFGVLYGHVAKANLQWRTPVIGEAMAIFMGQDAYITPSWYEAKAIDGKVVPTWNYVAVHAYGAIEFFEDADRLLDMVTRLTDRHEYSRPSPWVVSDAPADYIASQLKGIVGVKLSLTRVDAKTKMSQNRSQVDRETIARNMSGLKAR